MSDPSHRFRGIGAQQPVRAELNFDEETWLDVKAAIIIEAGTIANDILELPIEVL